jgi:hypothetical protein
LDHRRDPCIRRLIIRLMVRLTVGPIVRLPVGGEQGLHVCESGKSIG